MVQIVDTNEDATENVPSVSQTSLAEEYCPRTGEPYVAYDTKLGKLVSNQEIYESDVYAIEEGMNNLTFTSIIAGNLKDLFDQKFEAYRSSLGKMQNIAPNQISQQLESTVDQFFGTIEQSLREVECKVIERINSSKNLAELESILANAESGFGFQDEKIYEGARTEIENLVKKNQFSAVVLKKDQYEGFIKQMNTQNQNMSTAV